jgi:hypothetical protein
VRTRRLFRPGARRAGLLAVTAACGLAVVPASAAAVAGHPVAGHTVAGAVPADGSTAPASAVSAVTAAHGTARPLILINGDLLLVRSAAGGQQVAVRAAVRGDDVISLRAAGRVTEIPAMAMPFIGHGLSPALFQVSALRQAEVHGRLPVRVSFTGRRPSLPGITVTRSAGGTATGYLTPSSARAFGAALRRQFLADHATGRYGRDGLFGHGVQISLAGSAPLPVSPPAFPMHTLTVHGTDLKGRPDTGDDIFIVSADNVQRFFPLFGNDNIFVNGTTKFSVPSGHYWAVATFFAGNSLRTVVLPQFTVRGAHSAVHVSAKSATSRVTAPTPRPSVNTETTFTIVRGEGQGGTFTFGQGAGGISLWVNPTTRKPTVGTLTTYTMITKLSPAGASPGYAYNLDFPGPDGTIPAQHFTVPAASVATVTENYYDDVKTKQGGWVAFGGTARQLRSGEFLEIFPLAMPQVQTQYFTAGPKVQWSNESFTALGSIFDSSNDVFRAYPPGGTQSQDWNRYPLHPAEGTAPPGTGSASLILVSAAREGNTLLLSPVPFTDNQPGHIGEGFFSGSAKVTGSFTVDQNGTQIAHGNALKGIPGIRLSPRPSKIRFVLSASRSARPFQLSPASRTVWTWRSVRDTAARVPDTWYCSVTRQFTADRRCAVQPLMTLNYLVQGESLRGLTAPGAQAIALSVGHLQLGASPAVRGATAQGSDHDGQPWQRATVTDQGSGQFRVGYTAPAGATVTLRVSATDAAHGSVTETITRAYGVSQ